MQSKILFLFWFVYTKFFLKFKTRSALEAYQKNKVNELCLNWSDRFDSDEFFNTPILTKEAYLKEFAKYNRPELTYEECLSFAKEQEHNRCFSAKLRGYSIGISSGTSGKSGIFITNDDEQAKWFGVILARTLPITLIISKLIRLQKLKVVLVLRNSNGLYEKSSGVLVDFNFVDLMKSNSIFEDICELSPDILIAPATILTKLANINISRAQRLKPRAVLSVAEVLEDKTMLEKSFLCKVKNIYQATEGFLGYTCPNGNMHLNEAFVKINKIYVTNNVFYPVITDFSRKSQLINNLMLNDLLEVETVANCSCGSKELIIKRILGRSDEVIEHNKNTIFPDQIRQVFFSLKSEVNDYQVIYNSVNTSLEILISPFSQEIINDLYLPIQKLFQDNGLKIEFKEKVLINDGSKNIRIKVVN